MVAHVHVTQSPPVTTKTPGTQWASNKCHFQPQASFHTGLHARLPAQGPLGAAGVEVGEGWGLAYLSSPSSLRKRKRL